MGLIIDHNGPADEYEAIALPDQGNLGSAVFVRRSARPSRRAVLHLHELADSLAPADLVRWYNERGFHFYLTDVESGDQAQPSRARPRSPRSTPPAVTCARPMASMRSS